MKLIFCGTPMFAVPSLERLAAAGFEMQLVVTQPDRPQGRGMTLTAPPVKQSALKLGLPVIQPEKIRKNEEFQSQLRSLKPDAIIVVGYGRIIPPIANGETVSGVTTMLLNEGLDTGDILLQKEMAIRPEDTAVTYAPRLAEMGADMIVETLRGLEDKTIAPVPQDHAKATLAPILKKEDGLVDFTRTATEIHNRLRGFQPWPGAYTQFRGKSLKLIGARPEDTLSNLEPGKLRVGDEKLFVGCGTRTVLELLQIQPEGKKVMAAREFINGYHPAAGERLV